MNVQFGTDGVRGPADRWPLDDEGAYAIGRGVALWADGGDVVVGWDTRASSPRIADAIEAGLRAGGSRALRAGVLPTAALSVAVPALRAAAGLMITASHNPWTDNGVKVLAPDGTKAEDEAGLSAAINAHAPPRAGRGAGHTLDDAAGPWRAALPTPRLDGLKILVDCGHGAAAPHAPDILRALGASLCEVGCAPDGRNINDGCGALHPPTDLQGAAVGLALDGDADRLALVDPELGALDGDDLLWLLAGADPARRPVVGTVMSNGGLEAALGGRLVRVPVGDRHVAMGMRAHGAAVGGEPSGHVLYEGGPPTACGLAVALAALAGGLPLAPRLRGPRGWTRWPMARRDLRLAPDAPRRDLSTLRGVAEAEAAGARVVVRYSGTEPLVRVMVEGLDAHAHADRILAELQP